ncbi:MAG: efflux RND transporter periplasmic adaptor subunit [Bacteroidetes bacterium]|nr:efflux RND transporter periplasmic adaptor subunit [Bacteroidota bacterium]
MKKIIIIFSISLILLAAGYGVYKYFIQKPPEVKTEAKGELYICPMHPQIQSDHPGVCPICNMDLVLKESSAEENEFDSLKLAGNNTGEVVISPSQQVLANVQTEKVVLRQFRSSSDYNGYIKAAENNMRHIATPVSGKIIKMYVNYEGQQVSKGQRVFDIYSPEIYSTQKEYLLALKNYMNAKSSGNSLVIEQAESLIRSGKTRMKLMELTDTQIEELENSGEVKDYISVYSKYSGVVSRKIDNEGHWAMAGENILDIEDLSTLWVIANVPESEIKNITMGQSGKITTVSYPDEVFYAKVNFISPVFSVETRTLEVRLDVSNRNYRLKPDMYVNVELGQGKYEWTILVPRYSVLRTGDMDMVYLRKEKNVFVPVKVTLSGEMDGMYSISSGLSEGDEIVTNAGFLIDSESRIRTGSSSRVMEGMEMNVKEEPGLKKGNDIFKDLKEHKH